MTIPGPPTADAATRTATASAPGTAAPPRRSPILVPAQLGSEVAAYVRDLILSGGVRPGAFLRIDQLASTLGVSTTPVREGLLALRGEGFVVVEPRRGFRVAPLSTTDLRDLYWAQAEIAAELAARATNGGDAGLVPDLDAIDREMRGAIELGDMAAVEAANHAFHRRINQAAGAPKLTWLLSSVVRYAPRRFYARVPGWPAASVADHAGILAAVRAGAADRAGAAMRTHIVHAGDLLLDNLRERADPGPAGDRSGR